MTFSNEIQQTKEDIAVLQKKLKKLEELEIQKSKSPVEKAFKEVYGYYPEGCERSVWFAFQKGYEVAHKDAVENNKNFEPTPQEQENNEWRNVALRFGEELVSIGPCGYDDMTANYWLEWAKDAYGKNCDGWLKLVLEKQRKYEALTKKLQEKTVIEPTPPTLLDIVYEWCDDDNDLPCEELVNRIEQWLPDDKFDPNEPYEIGWNDALHTIKDKLR